VHAIVRRDTDRWRLANIGGRVTLHEADLTDAGAVRRIVGSAAPDFVFHLAKHRGNPATIDYRSAYAHNLDATLNLLEAVHGLALRRFVQIGSSLEYDLERSPLRESDAPAPRTVHGVTKAAASLLVQHFARERGVPAVVLRLFTVYGPWEAPTRFVPKLMLAALEEGRPLVVTAERELAHDWILVDDVVEACVRGATAAGVEGEIINVATGRESTNEQLIDVVERLVGRQIPRAAVPFPKRPWDTSHWVADVTVARDLLGWQAEADLETGLARTLDWFGRHMESYRERLT
jgi:nucleoside-diphosphate-sugar epimerase